MWVEQINYRILASWLFGLYGFAFLAFGIFVACLDGRELLSYEVFDILFVSLMVIFVGCSSGFAFIFFANAGDQR